MNLHHGREIWHKKIFKRAKGVSYSLLVLIEIDNKFLV